MLNHRKVEVGGGVVHVAESGAKDRQAVLFLHGWPENWRAYERITAIAGEEFYAVAIDLPGIGDSAFPNAPAAKGDIAGLLHETARALEIGNPIVVGHDVGGQVAFSYLCEYTDSVAAAVIMDVVIPGLRPWDEVLRNPYLWHFAFHSIPGLPETVVAGRQREYFEYFYGAIAAHPERITGELKDDYARAYSSPASLTTGFNWYRGFAEDVKRNRAIVGGGRTVETPVLYLRGERSGGKLEEYAMGLAEAGLSNLTTGTIPDCGHFVSVEQPETVWEIIRGFVRRLPIAGGPL